MPALVGCKGLLGICKELFWEVKVPIAAELKFFQLISCNGFGLLHSGVQILFSSFNCVLLLQQQYMDIPGLFCNLQ